MLTNVNIKVNMTNVMLFNIFFNLSFKMATRFAITII